MPPAGGRKGRKDREIRRLQAQLNAERREKARLAREVSALRRELTAGRSPVEQSLRRLRRGASKQPPERRLLEKATRRAHHYRQKSFPRYLWETVKESAPAVIVTKLVVYLRRVRVVRIILSLLLAVGAVATVAVLSAAVLPFLFLGAALLTVLAALRSRRMNQVLLEALRHRRVRVLVPSGKAALTEDSFFVRNARAMAAEEGVAVIVIAPYTLSSRGLGGQGAYFTARRETDDLYLARRYYFFILRRRVLDILDGEITVMY